MSFSILVRRKARADIRAAALWYKKQSPALARKFLLSVDDAINRLRATPKMHQIVVDDVRRKLLHKFPYFLYYYHENSRAAVMGLFHTSRDPQVWQDRIEDESQDEVE